MEVELTADQKAFVSEGVKSGRYLREEDALREALTLWEVRERRRAEILAGVDQAEASFAEGKGRKITTRQEAKQLTGEIARRGAARLADPKTNP